MVQLALIEKFIQNPTHSEVAISSLEELKKYFKDKNNLLELVEDMEIGFNHKDPIVRSRTVLLLNKLLNLFPLNTKEWLLLVQFFCSRLQEMSSVEPSLDALLYLIQQKPADDNEEVNNMLFSIPKNIFAEISVQSLPQLTRHLFYQIIFSLLQNPKAPKYLDNLEFLRGFIQSMDGEKDPRNLLLSFQILQTIFSFCDMSELAEDFFDVCSCYFPITFKPPPNDPFRIKPEDLKSELLKCMTGSPLFGQFALPLLMEKLSSQLEASRKDSMEVLSVGCRVYSFDVIYPQMNDIWKQLEQIFKEGNENLLQPAYQLIRNLITVWADYRLLSGSEENDTFISFLDKILAQSMSYLDTKSETRNTKIFSRLLAQLIFASKETANYLLQLLLPKFIEIGNENVEQMPLIIEMISEWLLAASKWSPFDQFYFDLFSFLFAFLKQKENSVTSIVAAIYCLKYGMEMKLFEKQFEQIVDFTLKEFIWSQKPNSDILNANQELLFSLSKMNPKLVWAKSRDYFEKLESPEQSKEVLISFFGKLAHNSDLTQKIIEFEYRNLIKSLETSSSTLYLDVLKVHLEQQSTSECIKTISISELIKTVKEKELSDDFQKSFCSLLTLLMRQSDFKEQHNLFSFVINEEVEGSFFALCAPILTQSRPEILTGCFESVSDDKLLNFVDKAVSSSISPLNRFSYCQILAVLLNKCQKSQMLTKKMETVIEYVKQILTEEPFNSNALALWNWLIKALLLRGDKKAFEMLELNFSLLSTIGEPVAESFQLIVQDSAALCQESFAIIRPLANQRLFYHFLPKLETSLKQHEGNQQKLLMISFAPILKITPKSVLFDHASSLMPSLFNALSIDHFYLKLSTLQLFKTIQEEQPEKFYSDTAALIKVFLQLSQLPNKLQIRLLALECLTLISKCPYDRIFPYKKQVIRDLSTTLNDPKRLVRQQAALCRNKWFLLMEK